MKIPFLFDFMPRKYIYCLLLGIFTLNLLAPYTVQAAVLPYMPTPGTLVMGGVKADLPLPLAIEFLDNNPFHLKFVLSRTGNNDSAYIKKQAQAVAKYFFAALTIPAQDLWVNLSPYEKNRITPDNVANTELGQDLLGEDYILKQLAASLTHPDTPQGREYWNALRNLKSQISNLKSSEQSSLAKVWIVPGEMLIHEQSGKAGIVKATLKVSCEDNNPAMRHILPIIEKEVNEGKQFAHLRQIYYAVMLAGWFKKKLHDTILDTNYFDKNKTKGANNNDPQIREKIYNEYLKAFQMGAYNLTKKGSDFKSGAFNKIVTRQYFSGGAKLTMAADAPVIRGDVSSIGDEVDVSFRPVSGTNVAGLINERAFHSRAEDRRHLRYSPASVERNSLFQKAPERDVTDIVKDVIGARVVYQPGERIKPLDGDPQTNDWLLGLFAGFQKSLSELLFAHVPLGSLPWFNLFSSKIYRCLVENDIPKAMELVNENISTIMAERVKGSPDLMQDSIESFFREYRLNTLEQWIRVNPSQEGGIGVRLENSLKALSWRGPCDKTVTSIVALLEKKYYQAAIDKLTYAMIENGFQDYVAGPLARWIISRLQPDSADIFPKAEHLGMVVEAGPVEQDDYGRYLNELWQKNIGQPISLLSQEEIIIKNADAKLEKDKKQKGQRTLISEVKKSLGLGEDVKISFTPTEDESELFLQSLPDGSWGWSDGIALQENGVTVIHIPLQFILNRSTSWLVRTKLVKAIVAQRLGRAEAADIALLQESVQAALKLLRQSREQYIASQTKKQKSKWEESLREILSPLLVNTNKAGKEYLVENIAHATIGEILKHGDITKIYSDWVQMMIDYRKVNLRQGVSREQLQGILLDLEWRMRRDAGTIGGSWAALGQLVDVLARELSIALNENQHTVTVEHLMQAKAAILYMASGVKTEDILSRLDLGTNVSVAQLFDSFQPVVGVFMGYEPPLPVVELPAPKVSEVREILKPILSDIHKQGDLAVAIGEWACGQLVEEKLLNGVVDGITTDISTPGLIAMVRKFYERKQSTCLRFTAQNSLGQQRNLVLFLLHTDRSNQPCVAIGPAPSTQEDVWRKPQYLCSEVLPEWIKDVGDGRFKTAKNDEIIEREMPFGVQSIKADIAGPFAERIVIGLAKDLFKEKKLLVRDISLIKNVVINLTEADINIAIGPNIYKCHFSARMIAPARVRLELAYNGKSIVHESYIDRSALVMSHADVPEARVSFGTVAKEYHEILDKRIAGSFAAIEKYSTSSGDDLSESQADAAVLRWMNESGAFWGDISQKDLDYWRSIAKENGLDGQKVYFLPSVDEYNHLRYLWYIGEDIVDAQGYPRVAAAHYSPTRNSVYFSLWEIMRDKDPRALLTRRARYERKRVDGQEPVLSSQDYALLNRLIDKDHFKALRDVIHNGFFHARLRRSGKQVAAIARHIIDIARDKSDFRGEVIRYLMQEGIPYERCAPVCNILQQYNQYRDRVITASKNGGVSLSSVLSGADAGVYETGRPFYIDPAWSSTQLNGIEFSIKLL